MAKITEMEWIETLVPVRFHLFQCNGNPILFVNTVVS